jgi:ATP-dependent DNA ligase
MALPLRIPFGPMEALSVDTIPVGAAWQYEPKWDGFRALAFRDGDKIEIQSKSGRLMTRYFPELVATLGALKARKFVLDGELAVPIKREDKPALTKKLNALIAPPGFTGNAPGGPSRWSTERSGEWQPLKPKLVVEVCYDHFSGGRFRHGTRLVRWRPDKAPRQCTLDQVRQKKANLIALLS